MRKILVLRGGALGDFIVTLPALALLRERWPEARIELAGNPTAAQLARSRGLLAAVHSQHEARWAGLFGPAALTGEFATWLAGFDLVVSYWPDPDGALARHFPRQAGQLFLSAPALPTQAPAAAHYCEPLRTLGIEPRESHFHLRPGATNASEWSGTSAPLAGARGYVAIHPGSGSPGKNWPIENWFALIERLPGPVSLILGEVEMKSWRARPLPASVTLAINEPLEVLVPHLASCRLFVGHDSGISHLAAASGARCVLLFGPTDPAVWAPPSPLVRVLRRGTELSALSVEDVWQAVTPALADQT